MNEDINKIRLLVDRINTLGFFQRLFGWRSFRNGLLNISSSLTNISNELQSLSSKKEELHTALQKTTNELSAAQKEATRLEAVEIRLAESGHSKDREINRLTRELAAEQTAKDSLEEQLRSISKELGLYKERVQNTEYELKIASEENLRLKKDEEYRTEEYKNNVAALNSLREQLQRERAEELQQQREEELARLEGLKATWRAHETEVKNKLKALCSKHTITYIDQVPFKGEPDNTLYICEEHIVFDAKSPATDDLSNFPAYLKDQAEKARKYAKQDGVNTDIFFIVPSNTLPILKQLVFNMADYNVFIISLEVVEPLVLTLCKIEEYEFAEQLSPEDRENICRILGKFAHLSKRRIQVDAFFAKQFIELAYKCETSLPADIHDKVLEFERSEKLNPPVEKRAKSISTKELEGDATQIEKQADAKGIVISNEVISTALNEVTLYK